MACIIAVTVTVTINNSQKSKTVAEEVFAQKLKTATEKVTWNFCGCWHQTCPPIDTRTEILKLLIPIARHGCPCIVLSCHHLRVKT